MAGKNDFTRMFGMKQSSIEPRKKPKQARSRHLVEIILEGATRVLQKTELAHATSNKIASVAGVSIGSFYQYFPNKDSLMGLLVKRRMNAQAELLKKQLEELQGKPIREAIRAL